MDINRKLIALSLKWYDMRIHQGILAYAREHNWDIVANPHVGDPLDIPEADGRIVMLGPKDHRRVRMVEKANVPTIDLSYYSQIDLPRVYPDNVQAGRIAADEFLSRGFTNFAAFSMQTHWYVEDRRNGFSSALKEKGFDAEKWHLPQTDLHKGAFSTSGSAKKIIHQWLSESPKPIAVYTIEDEGAAMLMRACHQLNISVPEQVAFISTNNDPVVCPYTEVPLSSIDLNWEGVGYTAAAQLDLLLQGKELEHQTIQVAPKGLVSRKSSDIVAVPDLRVAKALSYIQENCHRHVSVSEITKALGVPMRTLQWAFKKSMNCCIQDEITKRRLECIEDMLLNTDRNIGQIAADLGFSSAQYMNHFFSKSMGKTPNEYRQSNLSKAL